MDHLVAAEAAEAVERTRDASAVPAQMELKATVTAASILSLVHHHGRLIASRTEAWRNERQRRQFH
jgi:hypothetical protein